MAFLQQVLPELGFRWRGFRKVRRQVCRRIRERAIGLGLGSYASYQRYLAEHPEEWQHLDALCRVTISRFRRDQRVWSVLAEELLPELAANLRRESTLAAWSAGCASGEEPYTLAILWLEEVAEQFPGVLLDLLATDTDAHLLARAHRAAYPRGSLSEIPEVWVERWFSTVDAEGSSGTDPELLLAPSIRRRVRFEQQDIRQRMPSGPFHLILCRNLVFTYFAPELQERIAAELHARLVPGGTLVIGSHETLPNGVDGFKPHRREQCLLRRSARSLGASGRPGSKE